MIDYDVDTNGIATIAWNMADRPMNVLTEESLAAFAEAIERAIADAAVKGVVVTSARDDFLAGADLSMLMKLRGLDAAGIMTKGTRLQSLLRRIETCGKPFAAAINGTAVGGGYEICLACHYRVAADNPATRIGLPEVLVGRLPGTGWPQRRARLIGARAALPLMLEGRKLRVGEALKAGMIDRVVTPEALLDDAKAWLAAEPDPVKPWDRKDFRLPGGMVYGPKGMETFSAGSALLHAKTYGNYPAPRAIMSCVFEGLQVPIDVGLRIESRWFTWLIRRPEAHNMIRTLFFGIGNANKLRRRPAGYERTRYRKVGVLGAGTMGRGIAHVAAAAGVEVVLLDTEIARAERGKAYSARLLEKQVERGRMAAEERDAVLARIRPATDFAALEGSELVIEAVFEHRGVKAEVTRKAEAVIGADAIFASNTSTLPITSLAEASSRPASFIGLHFFSPVEKMQLVEIIRGRETSDACLAAAMDFVQRIGKTPIVVNDSRGFYTSRVFGTYVDEGMTMLAEGVAPALIENAGRMAGMPVGPLGVADEVGLDLVHKVRVQTREDLGSAYRPRPGDDVVALMVQTLGRHGRKAGKGFYAYPEERPKHIWPGLAEHFRLAAEQPPVEAVQRRLLYVQSLETARCIEEGVVTDPEDADVGSVLGWGFAPFHGGAVSMMETIGMARFVAECEALAQRYGERFAPPPLLRQKAETGEGFYPQVTA